MVEEKLKTTSMRLFEHELAYLEKHNLSFAKYVHSKINEDIECEQKSFIETKKKNLGQYLVILLVSCMFAMMTVLTTEILHFLIVLLIAVFFFGYSMYNIVFELVNWNG